MELYSDSDTVSSVLVSVVADTAIDSGSIPVGAFEHQMVHDWLLNEHKESTWRSAALHLERVCSMSRDLKSSVQASRVCDVVLSLTGPRAELFMEQSAQACFANEHSDGMARLS